MIIIILPKIKFLTGKSGLNWPVVLHKYLDNCSCFATLNTVFFFFFFSAQLNVTFSIT